jgi:transmembrane sensor
MNIHDAEPDWTLLARYFAGEASATDASVVERWVRAAPGRRDELAALRRAWQNASALPTPERIDGMWQRLAREMRRADDAERTGRYQPTVLKLVPRHSEPRTRRRKVGLAAAASIAVAVTGGIFWQEHRAAQVDGALEPLSEQVYVTERGQRKLLRLRDGSLVQLGVTSTLRVASYRSGRVVLDLEGLASFDVVHDPSRPFIVRAGNVVTEDLGTRFVVSAHPEDAQVRIAVAEGQVAVWPAQDLTGIERQRASARSGITVSAGEVGTVDRQGAMHVTRLQTLDAYFAWEQGRFVFQNVPLHVVAAELERWYDVDISIPDTTVATRRVTIAMPAGALENVLDAATVPLQLRYVRTDRTVVIRR